MCNNKNTNWISSPKRFNDICQGNLFLALGLASLINSSNEPNTKFSIDKEAGVITITATQDILTDEEITLKYL